MTLASLHHRHRQGFTFVELLVVMAISMFLLGLSVPFVSSLRSEIAMRLTVRQVKTDLITALGYSVSGKSITSLSGKRPSTDSTSAIPAAYGLYFKREASYGDENVYHYQEFGKDATLPMYDLAKESASPVVFLKDIRFKTVLNSNSFQSADRLTMLFYPPFGKVGFVTASAPLDIQGGLARKDSITQIQLEFQYKDDETKNTILTFGTDKVISML